MPSLMVAEYPLALIAHPATGVSCAGSFRVDAGVAIRARRLALRYRVRGPLDELRLDHRPGALPADRLWMHSCFEAFVSFGDARYREFNFAANRQWAVFDFSDYRRPLASAPVIGEAPCVESRRDGDAFFVKVELAESALPAAEGERALGLSAVLELGDGALVYFALAHCAARPDFHDRRSWLCRLAADAPA